MLNVCVIGLGGRGRGLIRGVLLKNSDVRIVAVCDRYEDRVSQTLEILREAGFDAKGYTDYREALNTKGLGAAFVFTDWSTHAEIAIYSMRKGIPVASEVGCEYSLENCHNLVRTQEIIPSVLCFNTYCRERKKFHRNAVSISCNACKSVTVKYKLRRHFLLKFLCRH